MAITYEAGMVRRALHHSARQEDQATGGSGIKVRERVRVEVCQSKGEEDASLK